MECVMYGHEKVMLSTQVWVYVRLKYTVCATGPNRRTMLAGD